ncbi:MAG: hypothetical protein GX051_09185 [Clostridiales bacterium]|nr:hypothetical protein [Clostridiales bacterium]
MSKYTQRIDALENNDRKKKGIFTTIIVLLVVIFFGGMVIGAQSILNTEGVWDPNEVRAEKPLDMNITKQDFVETLSSSQKASEDADSVRISVYTDVEIPDESIKVASGEQSIVTQLKYIKPKVLEQIKNYYKIYEGKFGEDFTSKLLPVSFGAENIDTAKCERGKLNDKGELTDYDTLFFSADFPEISFDAVQDSVLFNSFGMSVSQGICDMFLSDIGAVASSEDALITCNDFRITYEKDEKTGALKNIRYIRGYHVTLRLTFKGDLAGLGAQEISFDFSATESHWYTFAGLRLSEHTLSMEKGGVQAIEAYRTADEEVQVTWSSSNPSVASVDDKGYVKARSISAQPVIITAVFEYRGRTYTDTCEVFVRKPVDEIKLTSRTLDMRVGDTGRLSAEVLPKKATIHDVLWFTEDESIASVDENGVVTAVGVGTVKVFAVSVDGYYRSSCVVSVTQQGRGE